jgi:hypothetical protein
MMKKASHMIIGRGKETSVKIGLLKQNGANEIYVLDFHQKEDWFEKDGVKYLSLMSAAIGIREDTSIHYFMPDAKKRWEQIRRDKK